MNNHSDDISRFERQERLLNMLAEKQRVSIAQVCDVFGVSVATARRDLDELFQQGKIQRVRGGAIPIRSSPPEQPALERTLDQIREKEQIGKAAAQWIKDGETIFLGSGTTVLQLARCLRSRKNLTIITNSLLVINELVGNTEITIIDLGGIFRRSELSLIGHITEQALSEVRADKVFMGIHAVDPEQGLTNQYLPETMTDRAILAIGRKIILLADHTKCGCVSTAFVAPIQAVHVLVTDSGTSEEFLEAVRAKGIEVVIA
jgi:DeoR/GlpR family transcriptional regulator of sugar metabolism